MRQIKFEFVAEKKVFWSFCRNWKFFGFFLFKLLKSFPIFCSGRSRQTFRDRVGFGGRVAVPRTSCPGSNPTHSQKRAFRNLIVGGLEASLKEARKILRRFYCHQRDIWLEKSISCFQARTHLKSDLLMLSKIRPVKNVVVNFVVSSARTKVKPGPYSDGRPLRNSCYCWHAFRYCGSYLEASGQLDSVKCGYNHSTKCHESLTGACIYKSVFRDILKITCSHKYCHFQ